MNDRDRNPNDPQASEPFHMRKPGTGPHVPTASEAAAAADKGQGGEQKDKPQDHDKKGGDDKKGDDKKPPYRYEPDPDAPLRPHRTSSRAELLVKPPRVLMTPDAYKRMCLYIEIAPKEVGWLGTVKRLKNGDFLIEEVFLVEQEVTGVETELSVEGREKLILDLLADGDAGLDKSNTLHFWGHSHVRMSTGPSGTDENTMLQFGSEGHPYYLRGIFTKLGKGEFTVYLFEQGYRVIDAPWAVWDPAKNEIILEPNPGPSWGGGYRSWERQDNGDGGSIFGFRREEPIFIKKDKPLPPQLVPDDALRASVQAEYDAKVSERRVFFKKWFGGKDDEEQVDLVADGDCIPTGFDTGDGAPPHIVPGTGQPARKENAPAKPSESSGGVSGFFDWFFGLFSSPSQPSAPVTRPQAQPPAGPPASKDAKDAAPTAARPGNAGAPPAPPAGGSNPSDSTPSDKSGK